MIKERRDILRRILDRIQEMQPSISEEQAVEIEKQIRQEYGGDEGYIQKKSAAERRKKIERMFDGRNAEEVQQSMGISRATFYRSLKRKK
jgi:Mor family transcriptional regulator